MNGRPLRLFVAVDPPPSAVAHLGEAVDALAVSRANAPGRSTRLAARTRWHVTLAFLGDVPADRVEDASAAVAAAALTPAAPITAEPITVWFAGGGTFGRGRFAVLWAGLAGDVPALTELAGAVKRELKRRRLPVDAKAFRPHLTLARPGGRVPPESLLEDVSALRTYRGPQWRVEAVHLVASELGPDPRHERLFTAALPSAPP